MDLDINIIDIEPKNIEAIDDKQLACSFWFKASSSTLMEDLFKAKNILEFLKVRFFEIKNRKEPKDLFSVFIKSGGKIKAAFHKKGGCIGIAMHGRYYLFPRIKDFSVYPPAPEGDFLACILVADGFGEMGIEQRLLLSIEKELIKKGRYVLESIGKRLNEDSEIKDYEEYPVIPVKFLINNGFYIKKNDDTFPLLKIDLRSLQKTLSKEEELLEKYFFKKKPVKTFLFKKIFGKFAKS